MDRFRPAPRWMRLRFPLATQAPTRPGASGKRSGRTVRARDDPSGATSAGACAWRCVRSRHRGSTSVMMIGITARSSSSWRARSSRSTWGCLTAIPGLLLRSGSSWRSDSRPARSTDSVGIGLVVRGPFKLKVADSIPVARFFYVTVSWPWPSLGRPLPSPWLRRTQPDRNGSTSRKRGSSAPLSSRTTCRSSS